MGCGLRVTGYGLSALNLVSDQQILLAQECIIQMGTIRWIETKAGRMSTFWHLPSVGEWSDLFTYLGGFGAAGKKLKSTTGWDDNGNGDNNSSFNALPTGTYNADGRGMWNEYDVIVTIHAGRTVGLSVRCIKD